MGVRVVPVAVHAHARGGLWRPMTDASRSSGFEKKRALTRRWRWKRAAVFEAVLVSFDPTRTRGNAIFGARISPTSGHCYPRPRRAIPPNARDGCAR